MSLQPMTGGGMPNPQVIQMKHRRVASAPPARPLMVVRKGAAAEPPDRPLRVLKGYALKADDASLEGNVLKGHAAVCGNLDRGDDVIFPGAFTAAVLEAFLKHGFVADSHDWKWKSALAMPTVARMEGALLYTECEFHTTDDAQMVRTKMKERLDRGLSCGLSVGFSMESDGVMWFASGEELLKYAQGTGRDMSLFDTAALRKHDDWCRGILKVSELFEYSPALVPMNPAALATEAKGERGELPQTAREFEALLREAGYSKSLAAAITNRGFTATLREAEGGGEDETAQTSQRSRDSEQAEARKRLTALTLASIKRRHEGRASTRLLTAS